MFSNTISALGAPQLVAVSSELANGSYWLGEVSGQQPEVTARGKPVGAWGKRVDEVEAPFAPQYDREEYQNPGLQMLNLAELQMLATAFGVTPPWMCRPSGMELAGKTMLEVGCGTGRIALFGAGFGAEVTAVDQTEGYVLAAADKVARLPIGTPKPRLVVAPAEALTGENEADIVTAMFGVLNHCEDWTAIIKNLDGMLRAEGTFVLSMYGSPEAAVYAELQQGLPYAPAILTRRAPGGLLLGEDADDVLPARFPYPETVVETLEESGLAVESIQPFLSVTSLYPRQPTAENVAAFLRVVERRYGSTIGEYVGAYAGDPVRMLLASLCADYMIPPGRLNEAAYFGVVATKGGA